MSEKNLLNMINKFENEKKASLHPPIAPKLHKLNPPPSPKTQEKIKSDIPESLSKIDWVKLAQSSDFKRAVYLALEGKSWRGTNKNLDKTLNKKITIFRDPNFSGAVKEMKNMFKNGFMKPSDIIKEQEKIENE